MDDETLSSIRNKESLINIKDKNMLEIIEKFQRFKF